MKSKSRTKISISRSLVFTAYANKITKCGSQTVDVDMSRVYRWMLRHEEWSGCDDSPPNPTDRLQRQVRILCRAAGPLGVFNTLT